MAVGNSPNPQLTKLADEVDRIAGQVAGIIAFIEATGSPIPDADFQTVQGLAQKMARNRVGTNPNGAPALYAGQTVDQLQKAAKARFFP